MPFLLNASTKCKKKKTSKQEFNKDLLAETLLSTKY